MNHERLYRLLTLSVMGLVLTLGLASCTQNTSASLETDDVDIVSEATSNLGASLIVEAGDTATTEDGNARAAVEGEDAAVPEQATEEIEEETTVTEEGGRPDGWEEESHNNNVDPNYDVVFPENEVNQITITIAPEDWEAMQADMTDLFGEPGEGGGPGLPDGFAPPQDGELPEGFPPDGEGERPADFPFPGDGNRPEGVPPFGDGEMPERFAPPDGAPFQGGPGRFGGFSAENPMWVPATIEFEGNMWTNVGVRYKGNSSLMSGWRSGTEKLPFKLDFDEFEDEHPEIDDQRFYGFKQLSLANGFSDASFLRDAATYDILAEAGLPAAETAFYEVVLDHGEGPVSLGLYTVIEVIDDTAVERVFGNDDGNIYEADGAATSFAQGTAERIKESFQKENNEDEADWSDVEALYDLLHSDQRITDPEAWRASLEAIFDVDGFLEWLAISAVIQHWDTYGAMTHNYYLYNDPDTGQLTWISWDHNMAMSEGMGGMRGRGGTGRGPGGGVTLDRANVGDNWPLIRYLLDDPTYYDAYVTYVAETVEGPFDAERMEQLYLEMAELIEPYAVADVGEETFEAAVQQLIDHAYQRAEDVQVFLDEQ